MRSANPLAIGPANRRPACSAPQRVDLDELSAELRGCRICVDNPRGPALPHAPNPIFRVSTTSRLCIASQAAGTLAHASSLPFNDRSGDRLRAWLELSREEFYDRTRVAIVPMGLCFPGQDASGGDLPPRRECAPAWRSRIFAAMPQIELVLAVGQYAQAWHIGAERKASLTATVAAWRSIYAAPRRPKVLPLPHPSWRNNAWVKRNPWFEAELLPFLRGEVRRLLSAPEEETDFHNLVKRSPAGQN